MNTAAQMARYVKERPTEFSDDAAGMLLTQEMEITKLRYALMQIADGNEPLTVMRSIARQALNRK